MKRIIRDLTICVASLACMLSASWPLFLLVRGHILMRAVLPGLLVVAITGFVLRRITPRGLTTLVTQFGVAGLCVAIFLVTRSASLSPSGLFNLIHDANTTVSTSVAPLVAHTGVLAAFLIAALAIGIVIDVIGATSRVPMLVALPMGATFVLATMALGHALPAHYFVAAAMSWTLLLWACSESWQPTWRSSASWLGMTVAALVAALTLAGLTPHRSSPALGRQGSAGGADTSVNFSSTLDLSKDLHSNNNAPVLRYATSSHTPDPIRVTVSDHYADGSWKADLDTKDAVTLHSGSSIETSGYDPQVESRNVQFAVTLDGIAPPLLPAPAPVLRVDLDSANQVFRMTKNSGLPLISQTPSSYSLTYRSLLSDAHPSSNDSGAHDQSVTAADLDTSMLSDVARQHIDALTQAAAQKASGYFPKAVALQTYLRTNPQFTYSLTLAPTQVVNGKALDPLSNFLVTRQGYCTQYATAMIMAARSLGIPARIAIGFLPGTASHGGYIVRARDAHAWPELYFPGMGWTRFDPTPGSRSGSAPPYAPDPSDSGSTATSSSPTPSTSTSTAPASTTTAPSTPTSTIVPSTRHLAPLKHPSTFPWAMLSEILLGVALLMVFVGFLPWAGWRERSRLTRKATNDTQREEGAWHAMMWHLADLGMPLVPALSPRATSTRFISDYPLASTELKDAMKRVGMSMEQARYSATPVRSVKSASERVIRAAQQDAGRVHRIRALLVPKSGLAWCRRHMRSLPRGRGSK